MNIQLCNCVKVVFIVVIICSTYLPAVTFSACFSSSKVKDTCVGPLGYTERADAVCYQSTFWNRPSVAWKTCGYSSAAQVPFEGSYCSWQAVDNKPAPVFPPICKESGVFISKLALYAQGCSFFATVGLATIYFASQLENTSSNVFIALLCTLGDGVFGFWMMMEWIKPNGCAMQFYQDSYADTSFTRQFFYPLVNVAVLLLMWTLVAARRRWLWMEGCCCRKKRVIITV